MDLETIILSEVSQKGNNIWYLLYVELKKWYNWTYFQNWQRLVEWKQREFGS